MFVNYILLWTYIALKCLKTIEFVPLPLNVMLFTDNVVKLKLQKSKSAITVPKSGHQVKQAAKEPFSNVTMSLSTIAPDVLAADKHIVIGAKYCINQLTQIHYYGRKPIPREVFKMIATVLQFHPSLSNITIANGLDVYGIYEISKILPISQITEVCLEHLNMKNAHYQLLLTEESNLNHLSLSKCTINDRIVENIVSQLKHPLPASKTLITLNLSCNLITDTGISFISDALRSNRCLQYLNLAGNMITDKGATYLFDSLMKFPLTDKEVDEKNKSYIQYCTQKVALVTEYFTDLISQPNKKMESKLVRKVNKKSKKGDDLHADSIAVETAGLTEFQRAKAFAESILGQFLHPYDKSNSVLEDNTHYCLGNHSLCYLNLAHNNLSIHSVRKLLSVLTYQKTYERTPKGLTRVIIEGNPLPANCAELHDLNYVLEALINVSQKKIKKIKSVKTHHRSSLA